MIPKMNRRFLPAIILLAVLFSLLMRDSIVYVNNARLKTAMRSLPQSTATLEEAVPFQWTAVYTFSPYTPLEVIREVTGSDSPALKESVSEGMTQLVFVNKDRVVSSVCAYPENIGYAVSFYGVASKHSESDGGYFRINYGDGTAFTVTQDNGVVRLNVIAET